MTVAITHRSLADQAREVLLDMILSGQLQADSRINESQLAEQLGLSRTPLRHALAGLERDGFIVSHTGRGFFVTPLSQEEANELYPILGALEAAAVRVTGVTTAERFAELAEINGRLAAVGNDASEVIRLNFAWHERLVRDCPNQRLTNMVRSMWLQVRRYEFAIFAPGEARVRQSVELHEGITRALAEVDFERAGALMEAHWLTDLDGLLPLMMPDSTPASTLAPSSRNGAA